MNFKELFEFNYNNNYFLSYQCVKVKNHLWPTPIFFLFPTKKWGKPQKPSDFVPGAMMKKCVFSLVTPQKRCFYFHHLMNSLF